MDDKTQRDHKLLRILVLLSVFVMELLQSKNYMMTYIRINQMEQSTNGMGKGLESPDKTHWNSGSKLQQISEFEPKVPHRQTIKVTNFKH